MKISLARWCHEFFGPQWGIEQFCDIAKKVGADGIELAPVSEWEVIRAAGLKMPLALLDFGPDIPPFSIGWNSDVHHEDVAAETLRLIRECEASQGLCNKVIAFSGMTISGQNINRSRSNCVRGMMSTGVIRAAEAAGVSLSFEPLNDKIDMAWRGHPGYEATTFKYVSEISGGAQSECLGGLFDVYHHQLMEGDIANGIRDNSQTINHIHVAGIGPKIPRGELNVGPQELSWRGIGQLIRDELPEDVWVGIEYIPTEGRNYIDDLQAAVDMLRGN